MCLLSFSQHIGVQNSCNSNQIPIVFGYQRHHHDGIVGPHQGFWGVQLWHWLHRWWHGAGPTSPEENPGGRSFKWPGCHLGLGILWPKYGDGRFSGTVFGLGCILEGHFFWHFFVLAPGGFCGFCGFYGSWLLELLAPMAHLSSIDQSISEACSPGACCASDSP